MATFFEIKHCVFCTKKGVTGLKTLRYEMGKTLKVNDKQVVSITNKFDLKQCDFSEQVFDFDANPMECSCDF